MCSDGERAAFQQLCGEELIDTLRLHHQNRHFYLVGLSNAGVSRKIADCASMACWRAQRLAKRCTASGVDRDMRKGKDPSDHAPIWAEFDL